MKIFNTSNHLESAFTSLEVVVNPSSKIFHDTLPNSPFIKKPKIGSLVMKGKELTADTGSKVDSRSKLASNTMGGVTAFSSVFGVLTLHKAHNSYNASNAMHDERGKTIAKLDASLRISQIIAGTSSVFSRFAPRSLSTANGWALLIAAFSMDFLYLGLAAFSAVSIHENNAFLNKLRKSEGNLTDLRSLLEELIGKGEVDLSKKISDQDVYTHLGIELRSMLDEIDPNLTEKLSNTTLGKSLFENKYSKFLQPVLTRMNITSEEGTLDLQRLKDNKDLIQRVQSKEKSFIYNRIIGFKGRQLLQRANEMQLYELLGDIKTKEYATEIVKELFQEIKICAKRQRLTSFTYFIAASIGIFLSALAKAAILPLDSVISKVGFLVFFLLLSYGDVREFIEAYNSGIRAGEYAKFILGIHLALGLLALSAFAVSTLLTGGIFPVASFIIIGGIWISIDIAMLFFMHRRDKEYAKDHPSLQEFLDKLQSSNIDYLSKETLEMFHKLPKLQREAILKSLIESNQELMGVYGAKLKIFMGQSSLTCESLEAKGKRLYTEFQNKVILIQKAFEKSNKTLIGKGKSLNQETLASHPCNQIFYRTFYNEIAKEEQQKFCIALGRKRLKNVVHKLINASLPIKEQSQKTVNLTRYNNIFLKYN